MNIINSFFLQNFKNKPKFKAVSFLFLLMSLIFGNLFGINLSNFNWNLLSLFLVPLVLESGNLVMMTLKKTEKGRANQQPLLNQFFINIFPSIKRGFLIGIFIEAFKVGS